ncbi:MAG TPA: M23 family metallopeptidase [Longimicrobiaceae bacterium]|jgi:murein DD-endopeptidase MepM/ murein hydrolase activator NlpD
MRRSRFLLPFSLGAFSMLALVAAVLWAAPGLPGRLHAALGGEVGASGVAAAPSDFADEAPPVDPAPGERLPAEDPPPAAAAPAADAGSDAGLLIPVQGVGAASLVDTYEQARGQGRRHDAIDIAAPRGTPVLASADGAVLKLFRSERGGITLYQLAPDRRTVYYYAHLDRYAPGMAEGRALRRGEVLGYVGDTGDAEPGNYHLHFEVTTTADPARYWGGVPRNPYPLLR